MGNGCRRPSTFTAQRIRFFGEELNALLTRLRAAYVVAADFNVVKFRLDELKISFLSYPDFVEAPHPALRHAITADLVTGKVRRTDHADNPNPPILHRKEAFLASDHPQPSLFAALTEAEEAEGLYEHPATIRFTLNWER